MSRFRTTVIGFIVLSMGMGLMIVLFTVMDHSLYSLHIPVSVSDAVYDLYPTNLMLLNLPKFRYMINSDVCAAVSEYRNLNIKAILLITSFAGDVESRSAIRRAYPKSELANLGVRRVFLLAVINRNSKSGKFYDSVSLNALLDESRRFEDIIQGNFYEAYRNLTYKHIMGLQWATQYCPNAEYIIKMDDDIVVDMYQLMDFLVNVEHKNPLLMGYVFRGMVPVREPANKWFVTHEEYPNSLYPPFLSGWLYVTTPEVAKILVNVSSKVHYFWIDDTYVTGIVAKYAGITHTDISEYFTSNSEYLECCLKSISREKYKCDYMVGPNGGDIELLLRFQQQAANCHVNKCPRRLPSKLLTKTCVTQWKEKPLRKGHSEVKPIQL